MYDLYWLYDKQVAVRLRPLTPGEKTLGHRECCRVVGDQVSLSRVALMMMKRGVCK